LPIATLLILPGAQAKSVIGHTGQVNLPRRMSYRTLGRIPTCMEAGRCLVFKAA
jgi:hypothetical protein